MSSPSLRVVKVGGSLFGMQGLSAAVRSWLNEQPPAVDVLIAGGGPLADAIRDADRTHRLGESAAHWLCIDAMSLTARMLAIMLDAPLLERLEDARRFARRQTQGACVLDTSEFLRSQEPDCPGAPLPHGWHVTSDSIAARTAEVLAASELVLLKSALPSRGDLDSLAHSGYVDAHFPIAAKRVAQIRFVNLRDGTEAVTAAAGG